MATIEWSDYSDMRNALYHKGAGKEEMKAMTDLPSKSQLKAVFQAIEDWWESEQATLKAAIDNAYGQTTTVALARKIMKAWVAWKLRRL